jgi:hypothetical protein
MSAVVRLIGIFGPGALWYVRNARAQEGIKMIEKKNPQDAGAKYVSKKRMAAKRNSTPLERQACAIPIGGWIRQLRNKIHLNTPVGCHEEHGRP